MEKNKTDIRIRGKEYTIVGTESPDYLQRIALHIDKKIGDMMLGNPTLSLEMGAVLAAINIADECFKAIETSDNLRKQIGEYLDDMSKDKSENNNLRIENEMLKLKMQQMKANSER